MYRILEELRTQYWYWFVRDALINHELEAPVAEDRAKKLKLLKSNAKITHTFGDEKIGEKLWELTGDEKIENEFQNNGSGLRGGSRTVPDYLPKYLDKVIPGSLTAYTEGPCKLFLVLESNSLTSAMMALARGLLFVLESNRNIIQNDSVLVNLTDDISNRCKLGLFGSPIKLLNVIEDIVDYLFPDNKWDEFTSVIDSDNENFDITNLRHPRVIKLEIVVPVVIGFAFLKARYFDGVHYLSKVCYVEKYLQLLSHKFLMKEELWGFDTKAAKKVGINPPNHEDSNIKGVFQQAFRMANPVFFHKSFNLE